MRLLITTFGSYGDLFPYLAIGQALRTRGDEVCLATSASYREVVEAAGLEFAEVRPKMTLDDAAMIEHVFDRRRGTERIMREMARQVRESYEDTLPLAQRADAVVTHPLTLAAVLAVEKLRKPWISTVLAPSSLVSAYDPPVPAPEPWVVHLRKLGVAPMRAFWTLGKRMIRSWVQPVEAFRRELGLPPGLHPMFEGAQSPELALALFSPVIGEVQPDWPAAIRLTGFPFYQSGPAELAPELARFLDDGSAPVVFTLGSSAVQVAGDFYVASLQAVQELKTRALFLTGKRAQGLPGTLPPGVLAWPYAPHEHVFPRAAAIVHQGGIGTTAQALRSGRPALVVPFAHDQFDNAARVRRIGTAETLWRSRYTQRTARIALAKLLEQPRYAEAAARVGAAIRAEDGVGAAAQAIDQYLRQPRRSV